MTIVGVGRGRTPISPCPAVARAGGVITAVGMGLALAFPSVPGTIAGFAAAGIRRGRVSLTSESPQRRRCITPGYTAGLRRPACQSSSVPAMPGFHAEAAQHAPRAPQRFHRKLRLHGLHLAPHRGEMPECFFAHLQEAVIHRRHCSTKFEATKNSTMPETMAIVASGMKTTMSWYQNATRCASSAT